MTEMSPLGTVCLIKPSMAGADKATLNRLQIKQGRAVYGVDMKIVDEQGKRLPHDGKAYGELMVRGPWITSGYYKLEDSDAHGDDGWFATGDVCTIDPDGYMEITDRSKDVIKSGGEWISSIDLENQAMGHPDVLQAAVIGVPHPKWDERPLLIVVPAPDKTPDLTAVNEYLSGRVAKWWLPDDMVLVDELPLGATGKVLKTKLREQFGDHQLPTA
jgi:fatty-acyl-CoA synthase